jgi:predicted nucleic acid-binding protein
MRDVVYLDVSAILKLIGTEPESDVLQAYLHERRARATSRVGVVETMRYVARDRERFRDQAAFVLSGVEIVELDPVVAEVAGSVLPSSLRTLDAIHIAAALQFGRDLEALVTYDRRMAGAAREAGLPVVSPGAERGSANP